MAEEIDVENGRKLWRARDLDLRSGHTAYRPAAVIDLYLYTNFHSNWRNVLWTDGRTDGRTDIFPSILLGRLSEVDLKMVDLQDTTNDGITLSDLAKYSMTQSIARSLCDSWASCYDLAMSLATTVRTIKHRSKMQTYKYTPVHDPV